MPIQKFAFRPRVVNMWRTGNSQALIWLQDYYVLKGPSVFEALNGTDDKSPYVLKLGFFSIEF